jgi:hypothetical protein
VGGTLFFSSSHPAHFTDVQFALLPTAPRGRENKSLRCGTIFPPPRLNGYYEALAERGMVVRAALTRFLLRTCAVAFGAGVLIEDAQAQPGYVPAPTPLPPPVLNPSNPYTVPQAPYRSIAPATSSPATSTTVPGYRVTLPADERLARPAVRSHRRIPTAKTRAVRHRSRPLVRVAPEANSYYYAPFGYGYGCAWRRSWDGYWFRTSPCS